MKKLLLIIISIVFSGCASYEGIVSRESTPITSYGYIAGHFITEREVFTTAFVLKNIESNTEYVLPFTTKKGVEAGHIETNAISVPPGQYRLTHWIVFNSYWGTGALSREFKAKIEENEFSKPFSVNANQVVFLGKFSADNTWTHGYPYSTTRGRWDAKPIKYKEARIIWNRDFPAFSSLKLTCIACAAE